MSYPGSPPPPPYANITGISRTVMKDNAQETIGNYNGNARPGEIVADLTQDPPTLYIGNNLGELTLIGSGGGGYGNTQVAQFLTAGLVGNIIPAGNNINSLGNANNQWNGLYISNTTIYMNGVPISLGPGNTLTIDGNAVLTNNSNTSVSTTGNITADYFIGDGSQLTNLPGGGGNTGNVTFDNQIIQGTGNPEGGSGLYLAPGADSSANLQYLRVRGGDYPTHIHFDTGNNLYYDQYLGDDSKYVKIEGTGNIVINPQQDGGPSAQWIFSYNGSLTAPGAINVGDMSIGELPGYITATANTGIILNVSGPDGGFVVDYIKEDGNANTSQGELAFSSETGNTTYRISLTDDAGDGFATKIWRFDGTGNITLPSGGSVYSEGFTPSGNPGNTIILNPHGSGPITNQKLMIYPTAGDGDHLHMTTGNLYQTELFLGSDDFYVKLANTGNIVINSNDSVGNTAQWTFGTNGVATLPGEGVLRSIGDSVTLQTLNTISGNANSVYLGTSGGLGFNDQEIGGNWLEIFRSGAEPEIRVPVGRGNLTIQTAQGNTAYNWSFDNTGNLTIPGAMVVAGGIVGSGASPAPSLSGFSSVSAINVSASGNITAGNISTTGAGGDITLTGGDILGVNIVVTTPVPVANLTAVAGGRAFVNNSNVVALGNFGNIVSSGGSNVVPVWSDGINWYIG